MNFKGHVHVHTEYSPLDGLAKIEELVLLAKEYGQEFIAITDHGSSTGLYEATLIRDKYNFDILLGEEFYFENECSELKTGHLILIAKNQEGLKNILRLQRKAYGNFYYKPRINLEMLREHHEGLICTSACIANQIGQYILMGEPHLALNHIFELSNIFKDDFYIELQSSTVEDVIKVNKQLAEFCQNYNLQPILTNDVHYATKEDYETHEVLLAIQQGKKVSDNKRWKFETNDYWLKTEEEMLEYIPYLSEEFIEKCFNNIDCIRKKCEKVSFEQGNYLPEYETETGLSVDDELKVLTMEMYRTRIKERGENNPEFLADLQKELDVIEETGYSGYFLIVQEYINWAKKNGIQVGDGRGSGAGSKVAYTIGITEINPQKYDLLFERFLAKGRVPDFDVDFSDINAVFKHLQDRYGNDNVARVGAITRFTAKSALRKVMSFYEFSQSEIAKVVALLPKRLEFTLEEAIAESKELASWFDKHKNIYRVVKNFEGKMEHFSTHAGGVVVYKNLPELLPVFNESEDRDKLIVALDKKAIEALGHYKFDILGLESLVLMENITNYTGKINWANVDFEDEEIYKMLQSGDVLGVFQLSNQRDKVIEQQPKSFEDLIAINALIRPGVGDWSEYIERRNNRSKENVGYFKQPYLEGTAGVIVYQEQYLLLANTYAGWDIAYSDKHIRKNKRIIEDVELKDKFITDGVSRGYEEQELLTIWEDICKVVNGGYGFNRSHSASYAKLSFQTAYMKRYHPKEFYAAYLTQNMDDETKIVEVINILKELNIKIIQPDINKSTDKFIPTDEGILFPLTAIQGVGGSAWYEINRLKPIESFDDFLERRIKKFVKKTVIEALIKAGAFDFTGKSRYELLKQFNEDAEEQPNYIYEKESLRFYLSESPFDKFTLTPFNEFKSGDKMFTIVEITDVTTRYDKRGQEMAFVVGVNKTDVIRMVVFANVWKSSPFKEGELLLVRGMKDKESLLVNSIERM